MNSRPVSSFERLFASSSPSLGTMCQWMRLHRPNKEPYTPDELTKALLTVHRTIEPLQCILHKPEQVSDDNDDNTILLTVRPDIEPTIDYMKLPNDYLQDEVSPKFLEHVAAEEVTKGMGATPEDAYNKALWRAVILDDGWVVLVFHHVICDGYSRKLFVSRLLEALAHPDRDSAVDDLVRIELQPAAYDLIDDVIDKNKEKEDISEVEKETTAPPSIPCWPSPDIQAPITERCIQCPSTIITNVSILREKCKTNNVTITSMIVAALALTVRRQMAIPPNETIDMRKISWGVDIRRHLPNSQNLFGCYVFSDNAEDEELPIKSNNSVWTIASTVQKAMSKSSSLNLAHSRISDMKKTMEVPMTPEALMPFLALIDGPDQGRNGPLNVSNIGVLEGQSACGNAVVDRLFSITSQTHIGTYTWMNVVTIHDSLFVSLGSVWPTTSEERGKDMLDEFGEILLNL